MILTPLLVTAIQGLIDDNCIDINPMLIENIQKYIISDIQIKAKAIIESNKL